MLRIGSLGLGDSPFDCRVQIPCRDYRVRSLREAAPIRKSGLLCFGRLTRLASVNSVLVVRWKLTPSPVWQAKQSDPVSLLGLLNTGSGLERAKQLRFVKPGAALSSAPLQNFNSSAADAQRVTKKPE
jgi:hypothetical protein